MTMPAGARALIDASCESHGGLARWRSVEAIAGTVLALGGPIPRMKGLGLTFPAARSFRVHPHEQRVVFADYPSAGDRVIFQGGPDGASMALQVDGGAPSWHAHYRAEFAGLRKWRFWAPLDAGYFFGYALLTYLSVPFMLGRCDVAAWDERSVTVRFPADFDTHCRTQTFWFGSGALIVRHDYTADVLGSAFHGAHFSSDFAAVGGLKVARTRRVRPRLGRNIVLPVTVLAARLSFDGEDG
jgi:hypothetical protein